MDRLSRVRPVLAAVALALLPAAEPSFAQTEDNTVAQLVDRRGTVENQIGDARKWSDAAVGQLFLPADEVRTGADGWAAVLAADECDAPAAFARARAAGDDS